MVTATQPAHSAICRCDNCRGERGATEEMEVVRYGGNEWKHDGRSEPIEPSRHWLWYVVDVAVLVLALAMAWITLGGDGW